MGTKLTKRSCGGALNTLTNTPAARGADTGSAARNKSTYRPKSLHAISGIAFDIFGTVVDWRGTITREGCLLSTRVDWGSFADDWLSGYRSRVEGVRAGERPWANLDALLAEAFRELVIKYNLDDLKPANLKCFQSVWHRLRPWADAAGGLHRLRTKFRLGTLSNGNMLLLIDMARFSALPWDCILSAELVEKYKPERQPYEIAAEYLGPRPQQVIYVAAHEWDLEASKKAGLRTAFIPRPAEMGDPTAARKERVPGTAFDIYATDIEDLAFQLGT
jgi:2-haloacid dehalogenase